jgi:hypothetical protein
MVLEIDTTRRRKTITKEVLQEGKDCHAADNIYKNVDAAKMRNDLIDYFRASLRRTEVCLNKYIFAIFMIARHVASGCYNFNPPSRRRLTMALPIPAVPL